MKAIDSKAKLEVINKFVLPPSLHIPIAAKEKWIITKYIGDIECELSKKNTDRAFLVSIPHRKETNSKLPIWDLTESWILHRNLQVWVHVDYSGYRKAYQRAFPNESLDSKVLDHILNRRIARLKGYKYLRITPVDRKTNSSSAFSEQWGVDLHKTGHMIEVNKFSEQKIQYADLCDIVKMMNFMPGGGVMDVINEAQKLVVER